MLEPLKRTIPSPNGLSASTPKQVALCAAGLGEDDGLLRRAEFGGLGEGDLQRLGERLALGVVLDGGGEACEFVEVGCFRFDGGPIFARKRFDGVAFGPFFGRFIERLVVSVQLLLQRFGGFLLLELSL